MSTGLLTDWQNACAWWAMTNIIIVCCCFAERKRKKAAADERVWVDYDPTELTDTLSKNSKRNMETVARLFEDFHKHKYGYVKSLVANDMTLTELAEKLPL